MKKILILLIVLTLVIGIVACQDEEVSEVTEGTIQGLDYIDGEYKVRVKISPMMSRIIDIDEEEYNNLNVGDTYTIKD